MQTFIYGAGGQAKIAYDAIENGINKNIMVVGFIDDKKPAGEVVINNIKVLGSSQNLENIIKAHNIKGFFVAIGDNAVRKQIYEKLLSMNLEPVNAIHKTAVISPYAKIGKGVLINSGALINVNAVIGDNTIINTGAIIEHDNVLGSHVHIGPGACLGGTVEIGDLTFVGLNATIRNNTKIGKNSIVGMGSAVVKDVPDNVIYAGNPARFLKPYEDKK